MTTYPYISISMDGLHRVKTPSVSSLLNLHFEDLSRDNRLPTATASSATATATAVHVNDSMLRGITITLCETILASYLITRLQCILTVTSDDFWITVRLAVAYEIASMVTHIYGHTRIRLEFNGDFYTAINIRSQCSVDIRN